MHIFLDLTAVLLFACASSDDDVPTDAPAATLAGDEVIICAQIGGAVDPLTSTPVPSCAVGSNLDLTSGIRGHVTLSPNYRSGATPMTECLKLGDNLGIAATIALPINWPAPSDTVAASYTCANNSSIRLQPADLADNKRESLVSGRFDTIPTNLIVLAQVQ